jgi:hypothetical protein
MSGTYPSIPMPATVTIGEAAGSAPLKSLSQSGITFTRFLNRHRWVIKASYPYLTAEQGRALRAFVGAQQGGDKFQFVAASMQPRGVATGAPLVNGAGQTGYSLITDGWTINTTNIMRADDIIKLGNHSKVYQLAADVNSDALGQATLVLTTPLRTATTDNDVITVRDVPFTVIFDPTPEFTVQPGLRYSIDITMIEEL